MTPPSSKIYFDYHATTPVDPRVAQVVMHHMSIEFGNASSSDHAFGDAAEAAVETARAQVADLVQADRRGVVFTSGATESVNLAIQGFAAARRTAKPIRIITSAVEHACVRETVRALIRAGRAEVVEVPVDGKARISPVDLERACSRGADLVCVMAANNEVGNVYPVHEFARIAVRHGAAFLTDATQACGKVPLAIAGSDITFMALSGHKLYGPKGVGALIVQDPKALRGIVYGGEQELRLRPGTLNVPAIAGLGEACRFRQGEMALDEAAIAARRDRLQTLMLRIVPDAIVNGDQAARLAGNLHLSIPGVPNGAIIARVRERLAIATGAACTSRIEAASHVLAAMGLSPPLQEGALRIGLGKFTTDAEVEEAAAILGEAVRSVRARIAS